MNQPPAKAHLSARECRQVAICDRRGALFLLFCLAFIVAAVAVTTFMPRKYPGRALLQIHILSDRLSRPITSDPVTTEFPIITSEKTLSQIVKKFDLVDRWELGSPEEARVKLARRIDVSGNRGTDLIEITVFSADKKEAAELANTVAEAYVYRRKEIENERVNMGFLQLSQEIKGQAQQVDRARTRMFELVQELELEDLEDPAPWMKTKEDGALDHGKYGQCQQANDEWKMSQNILSHQLIQKRKRDISCGGMPRKLATLHERATVSDTDASSGFDTRFLQGTQFDQAIQFRQGTLISLLLGLALAGFLGAYILHRSGAAPHRR